MATTQQIAELRNEVQELTNAEPYTDDYLGDLIDAYGITDSARRIWIAKRNAVAALVDISEGGSSRKMSQVFDRYAQIAAGYTATDDSGTTTDGYAPRTRKIERI